MGSMPQALVRREGLMAHTGRIKATRGGLTLNGTTMSVDPTWRAERLELIRASHRFPLDESQAAGWAGDRL